MLNLSPKITTAGLALVREAAKTPGVSVAITNVAIGSQSYVPIGNEVALKQEFGRFPVSGGASIDGTQVNLGFTITNTDQQNRSTSSQWVGEIGFYAGDTLFAVLSKLEPAFFYKSQDIDIPIVYTIDITALPLGSVTVNSTAAPGTLSALIANHEANADAHPGLLITIRNAIVSMFAAANGSSLLGFKQGGVGSVTRTMEAKAAESVSVKDYGALPGSPSSQHAAFINAINALTAAGGGRLVVNGGGDYLIGQSILPSLITSDIEIVFEAGARLVAASGLSTPVMDLRASNSAITGRILTIRNPRIDCSAGSTQAGVQGCSGISAQYFKSLVIENPSIYGGENPNTSTADSGITPICCNYVLIDGGDIRGFSDGGVYIGGDNTAGAVGDGVTATVRGVLIERCNNAVLAKRDLNHLRVTGCAINECNSGVVGAEITTPNYTNPVRRLEVEGNRFKKIVANIVRFRGPCKGSMRDNEVEDWGYRFDGTSPAGANAYAVVIQGSTGIDVADNDFRIIDWPQNDQRAVLLQNVTLNGQQYVQGGHLFSGNSYRNVGRVVVEEVGGAASAYLNEYYEGLSTAKFSGLNAESVVTFREQGKPGLWLRSAGFERQMGHPAIIDSATGLTLAEKDSGYTYTNVGAPAEAVFNLPPAAKGLTFDFICMDDFGVRLQPAAGDLIRVNASISPAGGAAKSIVVGSAIRLTAVDATYWVAQSLTGTWVWA